MVRLPRPVTISMSWMPDRRASSTTYWMAGLSTTGSISLGCTLVAGRKRVPSPAAGITALLTFIAPSPVRGPPGRGNAGLAAYRDAALTFFVKASPLHTIPPRERADQGGPACPDAPGPGRAAPGGAAGRRPEDRGSRAGTPGRGRSAHRADRKSTRLNSSHITISYAVFCLKKNKTYDCTHAPYQQNQNNRNN